MSRETKHLRAGTLAILCLTSSFGALAVGCGANPSAPPGAEPAPPSQPSDAAPPVDSRSAPREAGDDPASDAAVLPVPDATPDDATAEVAPAFDGAVEVGSDVPASPPRAVVVYVSGAGEVARLSLDQATGAVTYRDAVPGPERAQYLAISPDRRWLYTHHGNSPGYVVAYAVAPEDGKLTKINQANTMGTSGPSHLHVHSSGRFVLVSQLGSGHVAVLPIAANGGVSAPVELRVARPGAHQIVFDRSGKHLLIPCRDSNVIALFLFDEQTGKLTPNDPPVVNVQGGGGPRHLALHPNERHAYLLTEANGTLTSYDYDASTGRVANPQSVRTVPGGVSESGTGHVLVHPSGRFVYSSNRFHDSIAMFTVDQNTGRLTSIGFERGDLNFPRDFDIDPSGQFMVVGNEGLGGGANGNMVVPFRIDLTSGRLTKVSAPHRAVRQPLSVRIVALP